MLLASRGHATGVVLRYHGRLRVCNPLGRPVRVRVSPAVETSSYAETPSSGTVTARTRRKLKLAAVDEALGAKSLSITVLSSLPKGCLVESNLSEWRDAVKKLVMIKGRRRIVTSSLVNIIRVLMMEMRMPFAALEVVLAVRNGVPALWLIPLRV